MRIAVCAPQVPFVRGGAEIFADTLVDELRARDHEAELVTVPFKWYPGTRVLDQAFLWRLLDLTESDGRPIDLVVATKFPSYCVRHPEQARLGAAPVPAGVRAGPNRSGPVLRRTVRPGAAALGPTSGPDRARRGEAALRHLPQRRRPDRALDRARTRGDAPPAAGAAVPLRGVRRLRPLGEPARPREADRPAARGSGSRPVAARRRHRRRARPRAARGAGARARAERPRRVHRPDRRSRSSPRSTLAASPSTTRPSTRTSGWCRTRRSCPRSPC